jgi:hypothetical protein
MRLLWSLQTPFGDLERQHPHQEGCQATQYHADQEPHSQATLTLYLHILCPYDLG